MVSNDILRRLRYVFDYSDLKLTEIFALADHKVSLEQLKCWLLRDDEEGYQELGDSDFALFLNGYVNFMRGKREGVQPPAESRLNNNIVFVKLKIALNLKAEEILEILELADFTLGKAELSAFFRNPSNKHYRKCNDQVLRRFLKGIQVKYRPSEQT